MALDLAQLSSISREVATSVDDRLSVVSVSSTEGGGNRVELLVTVEGCHREPCMHILNVSRAEVDQFEKEVRSQLQAALLDHRKASG
jgi:hypothetical protein